MVWAQYMLDDSGFCGIGHVSMYSVENVMALTAFEIEIIEINLGREGSQPAHASHEACFIRRSPTPSSYQYARVAGQVSNCNEFDSAHNMRTVWTAAMSRALHERLREIVLCQRCLRSYMNCLSAHVVHMGRYLFVR